MTSLLMIQASRSGRAGRGARRLVPLPARAGRGRRTGLVASASSSGWSWWSRQCCEVMNRAPPEAGCSPTSREGLGHVEVEPFDGVVELCRPRRQRLAVRGDQVADDGDQQLVLAAEVPVEGLQRDVGLLDEVLRREVLAPLEHEPVGGGEQRLGVGRSAGAVPPALAAVLAGRRVDGTPSTYRSARGA